jgi:hypothetical protein
MSTELSVFKDVRVKHHSVTAALTYESELPSRKSHKFLITVSRPRGDELWNGGNQITVNVMSHDN